RFSLESITGFYRFEEFRAIRHGRIFGVKVSGNQGIKALSPLLTEYFIDIYLSFIINYYIFIKTYTC
ncbi:MAG TPA: hypothetical protein PLL23_11950, partial [Chitinophagaceae bacterium]|nr:hypothetical protein [Chitinophagaceae bacterium]